MTLDEAIKHCEEVADTPCFTDEEARCYSEHRQLAEWLKELKAYKEQSGDEELDFVPEHKKIPCTMIIGKPCGDAISRKYILDLIDTKGANLDDDLLIVAQWIQDAPSVNPHPIECGDAISRQAVFDLPRQTIRNHLGGVVGDVVYVEDIKRLPSVSPQQRTGRWIDGEFGSKCSCCGIYTHLDRFDMPMKFKCCSMCGAKMEVEE